MKREIDNEYKLSIEQASAAEQRGDLDGAFSALERAHILGQRYLFRHLYTHWWMLKLGAQREDLGEVFGQIVRLLGTFPAYLVGWVPIGNTGGSNVSAIKPMPLPADIAHLFTEYSVRHGVLKRAALALCFALAGLAMLCIVSV